MKPSIIWQQKMAHYHIPMLNTCLVWPTIYGTRIREINRRIEANGYCGNETPYFCGDILWPDFLPAQRAAQRETYLVSMIQKV
jgi:hypothetical protein